MHPEKGEVHLYLGIKCTSLLEGILLYAVSVPIFGSLILAVYLTGRFQV